MKKIALLLVFSFSISFTYSQNNNWVNFVEAVNIFTGSAGQSFAVPMWEDSTLVITDGVTSATYWLHGMGQILDPASPLFGFVVGNDFDWFNPAHAFFLDSVRIYYWYFRPVTGATPDTLRIYIIPPSDMDCCYQLNDHPGPGDVTGNIAFLPYDYVKNEVTGSNLQVFDILLDDDDTSTVNLASKMFDVGSISLPIPIISNGEKLAGVVMQYISAQNWNLGDTLLDVSGTLNIVNELNRIDFLAYEELIGSFPITPTFAPSFNQGEVLDIDVRYDQAGSFNGAYRPTFSFVNFSYEHLYVDWKLRAIGANFLFDVKGPVVDFTDDSNFSQDQWSWDFGDGAGTSTQQDPTYTYAALDTFTACLTATNSSTTDEYTQCKDVIISCLVFSDFTTDTTHFCNSGTATLNSTSINATTYEWQEDGTPFSASANTTRSFSSVGIYVITLISGNGSCFDTTNQTIYVSTNADADFTATSVTASQYDFTPNNPDGISWLWNFGDANTSTMENPTHTYAATGIYDVCLTLTNACNFDSVCKPISIMCDSITTDFGHSVSALTVTFSDSSTNADSWLWDFGDSNTDTVRNPVHTYDSADVYTVCLTASSFCDDNKFCRTLDFLSGVPERSLETNVTVYPNPTNNGVMVFVDHGRIEKTSIRVYNLMGMLVYEIPAKDMARHVEFIDMSGMASGIYSIAVMTDKNRVLKKVVLMK